MADNVVFDLENVSYERSSGAWTGEFVAKTPECSRFKIRVSISDHASVGEFDGYEQTITAEVAATRLREKAHKALQSLLEQSTTNLRKVDGKV
ncbi:hypothetical protein ACFQ3K_14685 [Brucella gallinifaecis]|uniref:Uncharacterized protein n=1 Tax=Brucella gallinifaecis TaxID=215590 RepID=A0A502BST2_9HYPH|nr:hypothetical protein [Brucella gallinifaecis]TPF76711.1 hypothetical protein FHY56_04245 [Brucella gallinifaecis]